MSKFKILIVEDEMASQNLLSTIIANYCPQFCVVGLAANIEQAISMYNANLPDVLCLDYDLGQGNGFDVLDLLNTDQSMIIFTTAHEEHAIRAFKYQAVDYWLKPYTPKDVATSLNRICEKLNEKKLLKQKEKTFIHYQPHLDNTKLCVHTADGISVYQTANIIRLEGNGSYCHIYLKDGTSNLVSKTLKEVSSKMSNELFYRIHDSHVVNLNFVKEYKKEDGGVIILSNNDQVPISRRRKQEFLERLVSLQA